MFVELTNRILLSRMRSVYLLIKVSCRVGGVEGRLTKIFQPQKVVPKSPVCNFSVTVNKLQKFFYPKSLFLDANK